MLTQEIGRIIENSRRTGWVLEPDAKAVMRIHGLDVPDSVLTRDFETAEAFMARCGGAVAAKAVSPKILHKTEHRAVVIGIDSRERLKIEMDRLLALEGCENVLVEEMVQGVEVIMGAKNDFQFGPVVVFGMGGTSVEIYNDTAIRMAPLKPADVDSMVASLKARAFLTGYRGGQGVAMDVLTDTLVRFSHLVMDLADDATSIDLNPVMCTRDRCVVVDARIILTGV